MDKTRKQAVVEFKAGMMAVPDALFQVVARQAVDTLNNRDYGYSWTPERRRAFCDFLVEAGMVNLAEAEESVPEEEAAGDVLLGDGGGPA